LQKKKIYIINRNSGNQKIWFSSPISGADYFSYQSVKKTWLNDENIELKTKLISELKNFI
jgi:frataxin-like iron-binding protein CyaY